MMYFLRQAGHPFYYFNTKFQGQPGEPELRGQTR